LLRELGPVVRGRYEGAELTVPTLLLFGLNDGAMGSAAPREYAEHPAGSLTVELVEDSGHFIAEERPDLVVARARELLDA
jgi:pimeloyl-ACP methyl ester carboxylesterase